MAKPHNRFVRVAQIAYALSKKTLPLYAHLKSPHHYTLPQLNACVLLMFYLDFSYRDMELWLDATESVAAVLELTKIPSYSTLCRAVHRWRVAGLDALQRTLLDEVHVQEECIALDTTGFRPTQASLHYLARSGRTYLHFIKGGYAVGTHSLLVLGSVYGLGPGADTPYLEPLRQQARRYGRTVNGRSQVLWLGDAGFDGVTARASDLIPAIRRGGKAPTGQRRARTELVAAARLAGVYGQRWKCETVHSVMKRKFGDTIRARKPSHRRREPLVKGLIYNLHVL
jgi:hypothetical protein